MTATTSNEAVEQRRLMATERQALNAYMAAADSEADKAWEAYLVAVADREAAERHATVERIRAAMDIGPCHECSNADEIDRALDEEAAR